MGNTRESGKMREGRESQLWLGENPVTYPKGTCRLDG
jgi:hypothetical protein